MLISLFYLTETFYVHPRPHIYWQIMILFMHAYIFIYIYTHTHTENYLCACIWILCADKYIPFNLPFFFLPLRFASSLSTFLSFLLFFFFLSFLYEIHRLQWGWIYNISWNTTVFLVIIIIISLIRLQTLFLLHLSYHLNSNQKARVTRHWL